MFQVLHHRYILFCALLARTHRAFHGVLFPFTDTGVTCGTLGSPS
jgi:hypothetical protein